MTCPNTETCGSVMKREKENEMDDIFIVDGGVDEKWEFYSEITEVWECPNCGERMYRGLV